MPKSHRWCVEESPNLPINEADKIASEGIGSNYCEVLWKIGGFNISIRVNMQESMARGPFYCSAYEIGGMELIYKVIITEINSLTPCNRLA